MTIGVRPIEECVARWQKGSERALREALESPRTREQYDWGLGFAAMYLRKLTRKANSQAIVTFSGALLEQASLADVERVIVLPLAEGGVLIRPATAEDVRAAHGLYAANPPPVFPPKPRPEQLPEIENWCRQCGITYRTRSPRRRFCDDCRRERFLAQCRAWWKRKGKLTPSYRRKLRPRAATEIPLQLVPA